ncbi:beta-alanine-activating enzyme [Sitodiplosis mosellana]|uniref:beta-alanine-activating enzyme n=1 Tax=Sitodiplosis mosellana TaxID=263140 RepID=UPI002443ED2B|nr:beta-alanine-activating enzyme [Sitodiplosis mosellana]
MNFVYFHVYLGIKIKKKYLKKTKTSNRIMFNLSNIQKRGNSRVLKFYETADSSQIHSYADLYSDSTSLSTCLAKLLGSTVIDNCARGFNVAILLPVHSPAILPSIVGVENAGCVSCFLDFPQPIPYIKKRLVDFGTNIVLCDLENVIKLNAGDEQVEIISNITLFDRKCVLARFESITLNVNRHSNSDKDDTSKSSNIFFYATTSGSCGEVKPIGVTYKCFSPNIASIGKLYGITEHDVIFVSSPPTFDPFMVDICLALHHGASLIMTCNALRCDATVLLNILFPRDSDKIEVTIMQTTPSLFMRWSSSEISTRIFSSNTQLRILAFGGEAFPATSKISKWINWENSHMTKIFNLYGLTEMSCWAGIYELTKEDIRTNQRIPIGHPIDEQTEFEVNADGELLLKSKTRKCFQPKLTDAQVIDKDFEFVLHTGDLVEVTDDSNIYFTSRSNAIIKLYGRKINLCEIEACAKLVGVEESICIHDIKHNSIDLFVEIVGDFDDIKRQITKKLQQFGVHVKIYCVTSFPLTAHGKIDKSELLNTVYSNNDGQNSKPESVHLILKQLINESLGTQIELSIRLESSESHKKPKQDIDLSFIHLGGTSLKAIQIVNEFERNVSYSIPQVLTMLLDDRIAIRDILTYVLNVNKSSVENGEKPNETILEMTPCWRIDMKKCIDATPTVCVLDGMVIVSVGSHSKLLYNISVNDGKIVSKLELPDRIESQVTQLDGWGIVGCYDGHLYCFDIRTGCIKWKFNSGAMIKCRALVIGSRVIFGNYNDTDNLWCLEATNGRLIWSQRIGTTCSIYANPIKLDSDNCLVCCLDGTVSSVNSASGEIQWSFKAEAPVFSTPSVFMNNQHETQIILAAVNGRIYILNSDGVVRWNHKINGNIFSSIEYFTNPSDATCMNFVFGSQNHYLYSFKMDSKSECVENWQHEMSAPIRSTPVLVRKERKLYVGIFSSDGTFKLISCDIGRLVHQRKIDGDVFSTPAIHEQNLFVGSRNNFIYCIDLTDFD